MRNSALIKPVQFQHSGKNHATANPDQVWLFDLDNTLHDSRAMFTQINTKMTQVIMQSLNIDQPEADALRQKYWTRYGATAIGLQRHHDINLLDFVAQCHAFKVEAYARYKSSLRQMLHNLPGHKFVFTNAPNDYALRLLKFLKISQCFTGICSINSMRIHGKHHTKPSWPLMQQLNAQLRSIYGNARIIFIEDTPENLIPAHRLGMFTILISPKQQTPFKIRQRPSYVDLVLHDVLNLHRAKL